MTTTDGAGALPTEFTAWFAQTFGAAFPLPLAEPLSPVNDRVWVSANLVGRVEAPPMTPAFDAQLGDHVIAGLWGHGVNSSAFYYVEVRGPHRRFFRLPYGGGYGYLKSEVRDVLRYLEGYRGWQAQHEARWQASTLLHNMGVNRAELSLDGQEQTLTGSEDAVAWWTRLQPG